MGALFSNLEKTGVSSPSGSTNYYDNGAQAGQALAAASAKTAAPGTSSVNGSIGQPEISPIPMQNAGDVVPGPENTTVTQNAPPVAPQPKIVHPTWQQGQDNPQLLTKGGKLASLLLEAAQGAAVGAAASAPTNFGRTSVGWGPGAAAGFQLPYQQQQQRNELANEQLNQQLRRQQISALPLQMQQEHDLRQSEIDKNNATASRKDVFQAKDGSILQQQADGTLKTLYQAPSKPDLGDTVDGRQQIINQMKSASVGTPDYDSQGNLTGRTAGVPYTLSPAQEQQYLLTGKIPETKNANPNSSELLLRAAQGDQDALKALRIQSDMEIRTHQGFPGASASTDGLTAAQQRQLKTDATWSNLTRRMSALTQQYTKTAQFDPDGAATLSKQIDDLANQAETRKAQILQGGRLSLKGAGRAPAMASANAAPQKYKAGDTVMYQGKQHTVAGYDENGKLQLN